MLWKIGFGAMLVIGSAIGVASMFSPIGGTADATIIQALCLLVQGGSLAALMILD